VRSRHEADRYNGLGPSKERPDAGLLAANRKTVAGGPILTIAALLAFGLLAEEVVEGETLPFDRKLLLALRQASNPGVPIGPPWLPETARDISALGSTIVLGILLLAAVGYLLLTGRRAAAWLMLGAVSSGVALNSLLKFSFSRPRPDMVTPAVRVFTASFPSGHATMSAITYLTLGALWPEPIPRSRCGSIS
jgi:undecaprenyl-diphosphatase